MAYLDYDGLTAVKEHLDQIYQRQDNLYYRLDPIDGDITINQLAAADETTASALSTFNIDVNVRTPDEMGVFHPGAGAVEVFYAMDNRLYLAWMNNGVLEIGLVRISVDVQTKAITYSALGHTSMAYGVAEVDTEWTIEALPDDTPYELPPATASTLGGVKVGTGLSVETDGTLSVPGLTVLEYGKSTWADFQAAYNANKLVYCRYKMSANEVRMAFLAYTFPGKAEFQYYRTVGTKSDTQQGDEVYIYTLVKTKSAWTTTVRQNYAKIVAGTGLTSTYTYSASTNAGTLTLKSTPATTSALGGVKVGTGLSVAADGTLSTIGGSVTMEDTEVDAAVEAAWPVVLHTITRQGSAADNSICKYIGLADPTSLGTYITEAENDATVYVATNGDYALDTPTPHTLVRSGYLDDDLWSRVYSFVMPDSDVTVSVFYDD